MLHNLFKTFLLSALIGILFSCKNEEMEVRVIELQKRVSEDSTLLGKMSKQMAEINEVLDSVAAFNDAFRSTDESVNKDDAISNIRKMDALLTMNFKKIQNFENELDQTISILKKNPVIRKSIEDKKAEITSIRDYYVALEKRIKALEEENFNLKEMIKRQEKEMLEKDNIIEQIKKEREEQSRLLEVTKADVSKAQKEIARFEKELQDTKDRTEEQKSQIYFEHGTELKAIADEDKSLGFGKKKRKAQLYQEALESFEQAKKFGHPQAEKSIAVLKAEYAKFLEVKL